MAMTKQQLDEVKKKLLSKQQVSSPTTPSTAVIQAKARLLEQKAKNIAPAEKSKPVVPWSEISDKPRSTLSFLPGATADLFTKSAQKFGKTLGAALSVATGETGKQNEAAVSEADARLNLARAYNTATPEQKKNILSQLKGGSVVGVSTEQNTDLMKTNRQVFGEGLGTAMEALQGGGLSKLGALKAGGATGAATLRESVLSGAKVGAAYGGTSAGASAMQENKGFAQTTGDVAVGTALGGLTGGLTGAGAYKLGEGPRIRSEQKSLLMEGKPDARVAGLKLKNAVSAEAVKADGYSDDVTKVITDKPAQEVLRQGVDPKSVALIKKGNAADKAKMTKMLDIREAQRTDDSITDRATDVVGNTFVENIAKPIQKLNKDAGARLDIVAKSLKGKSVDLKKPVQTFADSLDNSGIKISDDGILDFDGSDFEGLPGPQKTISDAWKRALKVAKDGDAYDGHNAKRYIDNIVEYGSVEGQQGNAERMVKNFRRELDSILDTNFKDYNDVNTEYSETIAALEKMAQEMGTKFRIGDDFAGTAAGVTFRRLFGQGPSRAGLLQMLAETEKVAQKYGVKSSENIQAQARFATELERMFGSEAPTSMAGTLEGAGDRVMGAGLEALQSGFKAGAVKMVKGGLNALRGVNDEAKAKALRALLR